MTAKEYLSQLRLLDIKINHKIKEAEEMKALALNAGALRAEEEKVQTSLSGSSRQCDMIEKYVDLQTEIDSEIDSYVDLKHKIINEIHQLSDTRYVEILHRRYVDGEKFELIAVDMNYGYEWTCRLHGQALLAFEKEVILSHIES